MKDQVSGPDPLAAQLKNFIVDSLALSDIESATITDHEPLLGSRIGLDSLDALELALSIEEEYGVAIAGRMEMHAAFSSVASLADFIRARAPGNPAFLRASPLLKASA